MPTPNSVSDWYRADTYREQARQGVVRNPVGPATSFDPDDPTSPKHVIRGGSFLCSEVFCFSYRPAAKSRDRLLAMAAKEHDASNA